MAKMRAVDAAVLVLEKEGIDTAFGVPGAAINPFYSAMRKAGNISHVLARHVEGASHMAEGYTRAQPGNIGVCIGTSGPAGTDMITGLYSAQADSIPILAITGQAPRARLYKEDFQAVDIESIAKPVTKWAVTVREPALVPRVFQQAFHLMRSGRPGPVLVDLPIDVQLAEIEFDIDTYEPLPVYKPKATRKQIEAALTMLNDAEKPLIVSGGGVLNAAAEDLLVTFAETDRRAGDPDADVVGRDSRRPSADGRHGRSANLAPLRQRDDARVGLRARHRQPLGEPSHGQRRGLHEGPQVRARRYRADADRPRVRPGSRHRVGRESRARTVRRSGARMEGRRQAEGPQRMGRRLPATQAHDAAQDALRQRADEAAARVRRDEPGVRPRHLLREHDRFVADRRRAIPACVQGAQLDQLRPGRPARLDDSGGARRARGRSATADRRALGRLRLPVHDRRTRGRRAIQAAVRARGGEQLVPRPDPPGAARIRDGLLRAARLRQHQFAGD